MEYQINDMQKYTSGMAKSLHDKTYFMPFLDNSIEYIVDYGCADGAMIGYLAPLYPDITFIGYDNSECMINKARFNKSSSNVRFYDSWESVVSVTDRSKTALIFSSVFHEIYSYLSPVNVKDFWMHIRKYGAKYVCVRDMCFSDLMADNEVSAAAWGEFKSEIDKTSSSLSTVSLAAKLDPYAWLHYKEFSEYWGPPKIKRNMAHFLMKYRYVENWDRELRENYFAIGMNDLEDEFRDSGYETVYAERYVLPFLYDRVKQDFGENVANVLAKGGTHMKMVFRKQEAQRCTTGVARTR